MSDVAIVNQFFEDVKRMTKELDFFDARVKVALKHEEIGFLEYLFQHKNEIELLKKSTEILLQRMENDNNLRDLKGRKKVDSGYGGSAGSAFLEPPIQETECRNPTPSEHFDLSPSPENVSEKEEASCSSA